MKSLFLSLSWMDFCPSLCRNATGHCPPPTDQLRLEMTLADNNDHSVCVTAGSCDVNLNSKKATTVMGMSQDQSGNREPKSRV